MSVSIIHSAFGLVDQVVLQAYLLDLIPLYLGPIHMTLFHLENIRQQIRAGLVAHCVRQRAGLIVGPQSPSGGNLGRF